jgi:hypothetical protein
VSDIYEFHVAGRIGPVVRAALPELTTLDNPRHTVLIGSATNPAHVDELLEKLREHDLVADHILIARERRWS